MTVTVDVINHKTLNLLKNLESLGLIHVKSPILQELAEEVHENPPSYYKLMGVHKNLHNGSVEDFLADCRADKEQEFAIEKRQSEESERFAKARLSS